MQRDFASVLRERIEARQNRLRETAHVRSFRRNGFDIPHLNRVDVEAVSEATSKTAGTPPQEPKAMPSPRHLPRCFHVLGLDEGGDTAAVKRAFRRRALQLHPDRGGSHEGFIALVAAYEQALRLAA